MISLPFDVSSEFFTEQEQSVANKLGDRLLQSQGYLRRHAEYYEGTQPIQSLGIAVPEELQGLRSVTGWPRLAVDVLARRLAPNGFRFSNASDADTDLWDIWTENGMDQEAQLAHLDALIYGRSFVIVGAGQKPGDAPLITVESPTNMMCDFDVTSRQVRSALQIYEFDGMEAAAVYLPNSTVHLVRPDTNGYWELRDRDNHGLGRVPVVMLANRQRSQSRYGASEITPEIMSLNDSACRTLLGMEIAREFFGAPQRYILGASESAWQKPDGTPTKAWETITGHILGLERDEEGNVPTVGVFPANDPTPFTAILQDLSKRFAALAGLPPHIVGYSADNPASAEGIRSAEAELDKRSEGLQRTFEGPWRDVALLALLVKAGSLPEGATKLDVLWKDTTTPTPLATAQAVAQQVQMGYLPGDSEVTGEKLGYSAVERNRISTDRKRAQGASALQAIAARVGAQNGTGTNGAGPATPQSSPAAGAAKPAPAGPKPAAPPAR